jgi:hypothetical protein
MKNQTTRTTRQTRQAQPRPAPTRIPDPIDQHIRQRRIYTDFLALCLYPGMSPRRTDTAA